MRGATKIYRRACWNQIGGVRRGAGWDTLDEVKANMLGWTTRSFSNLPVIHCRFTGAANGRFRNAVKNGLWSHICGYHPAYILARSIRRLVETRSIVDAFGLTWGYATGFFMRVPRIDDEPMIRYLREQQIRRLLLRDTRWK